MPFEARVAVSAIFVIGAILVLFVDSSPPHTKLSKFLFRHWYGDILTRLLVRPDGSLRTYTKAYFFVVALLAAIAPWLPRWASIWSFLKPPTPR